MLPDLGVLAMHGKSTRKVHASIHSHHISSRNLAPESQTWEEGKRRIRCSVDYYETVKRLQLPWGFDLNHSIL